ncbi:unnamed protein product, partial [Rotaria socialis]
PPTLTTSSSSTTTAPTAPAVAMKQPIPMSIDDHTKYVLEKFFEWWDNNKENVLPEGFVLKENEHFTLTVTNCSANLAGLIKCKCGVITKLATKDGSNNSNSNEQPVTTSNIASTTLANHSTILQSTLLDPPSILSMSSNETSTREATKVVRVAKK